MWYVIIGIVLLLWYILHPPAHVKRALREAAKQQQDQNPPTN